MTTYYLILDRQLGKKEDNDCYLFENSTWVRDIYNEINDRLIGYDPSEDFDSPYKIGCTSIMDEIKEISEERAMQIINGQSTKA